MSTCSNPVGEAQDRDTGPRSPRRQRPVDRMEQPVVPREVARAGSFRCPAVALAASLAQNMPNARPLENSGLTKNAASPTERKSSPAYEVL